MKIFVRVIYLALIFSFFTTAQEINKPKNIIILIGDGMGLNYVSASLLQDIESPFYQFNSIGFAITKSADNLITDSAAGATAIATGHRTNNKYISVDPFNKPVYSIFEHAKSLGLSAGLVVTSDVVCATPSPFIAHHNSRYDKFLLAEQYIQSEVDVIIGGGTDYFLPVNSGGKRLDEQNLVDQIKLNGYNYFSKSDELLNVNPGQKFYALLERDGLPRASKRSYNLGDLTSIALNSLDRNPNGFILMIEGSQIDWAGHDNKVSYVLNEMSDFSTAISACLDFAEKDGNTLILITADHETGGMAIEDGESDGKNLQLDFSSTKHTAGVVPVFAKGPGEELFKGIYENYMIGRKLFHLLDETYQFTSGD
ncbi:MAG TPA: alkaline phosphatase [Ignavibacteriaceae bacterium]|nr:alkaline phosphatase [Ignavibacteriaceae bacterium]